LLHIVETAPKPVLIHCNAGADRTGLVAALYQVEHGVAPAQAAKELSLHYGHFPYLWSKTDAMDRSFAVFVAHRAASAP
jgi:undecaprenyl-diphosphatase